MGVKPAPRYLSQSSTVVSSSQTGLAHPLPRLMRAGTPPAIAISFSVRSWWCMSIGPKHQTPTPLSPTFCISCPRTILDSSLTSLQLSYDASRTGSPLGPAALFSTLDAWSFMRLSPPRSRRSFKASFPQSRATWLRRPPPSILGATTP